ncbi:MAG: bifunctional tRNA (5-methylaminomethyl-2-thiouridine)(34)-methyltransferase MnmD/FAD-dependent 5-carboxymethylaminomethyl-2-thiouridine(34) oxidoreductase MnmC [Pseudomonadota bacterium]
MVIKPAELAFEGDGTPFSPAYGDIYHSADSGPGQARHVFIAGNDLPGGWARKRVFTILETGFGLGLNFLATGSNGAPIPARPERLHFVSIEKHPFNRDALALLHLRYAEFAPLSQQLRAAWPLLLPGLHRLHFEDEQVTLTLAFGDVAELTPRLRLYADAIYLDGFAPRHNPEMWSPQLMKALARLSHPGTTVATYSSASIVREGLEAAGFALQTRAGFGRKREMLSGSYAPHWPRRGMAQAPSAPTDRRVIVVGAGLAGAAVSERLARRGWRIDLIERRSLQVAHDAGRYAGVFHPHISRDDCILSRAARNGFLYAVARWRALEHIGLPFAWARCGVLQLARDPAEERRMNEAIADLGYPAGYARYCDRTQAEALSACRLPGGGWWFSGAGWMRPLSLIAAQLAAAGAYGGTVSALAAHGGSAVHAIDRSAGEWRAFDADGTLVASAPVLVLANSNDTTRLAPLAQPLQRIRGQVSYVPARSVAAPRVVLAGNGYVLPEADGVVVTGSTYDRDDGDPEMQLQGHEANLMRLAQLLPQAPAGLDASTLDGAVGFRCVAPDRMPLVGALPDVVAARMRKASLSGAHLADLPRCPGLYCASAYASRGLIWAALAGETIASLIEGEPLPLEGDLADALDPARFVLKQARRGML